MNRPFGLILPVTACQKVRNCPSPGGMEDPGAVATYRVQLCPDFGFAQAADQAAYLAALGVSHLYASPYLQAVAGSSHGYDVVDPTCPNEELGGDVARQHMVATLRAANLRHILDIVPNHMAIRGGENGWWWDVLENGPSSRYASFFDVEWRTASSERVLLPILGDQYGVELDNGAIQVTREGGHFFVSYFEHHNPMAPRSVGHLLRPVADELGSDELGFVADALVDLPAPNATDAPSRRRRHRDKEQLQSALVSLCRHASIVNAIDRHLERVNASAEQLHELLERQIYRLAYWRVGNHDLEYRRFFDIDSLVGLRIEDVEVLETTHRLYFKWLDDGSVDGLRIDHIDGLYDPRQYLERLRQRAPRAWLIVEKILEGSESLPDWPVAGTSGYDFLNHAQRVLIDPTGEEPLTELYREVLAQDTPEDYAALAERSKRAVLRGGLASDVRRLVVRLAEICQSHRRHRDHARTELESAILELCVAFEVYRTYVTRERGASATDREVIRAACQRAKERRPQLDARLVDFIGSILELEVKGENELEFVMRFQQLSGPAMAKGIEDTAFYRYQRFVALNEVGGDPSHFATTVSEFHAEMKVRQRLSPYALNATSTHDTKRSEDVRARLLVLSEIPYRWRETFERWRARMAPHRTMGVLENGSPVPDAKLEYGLWQNLVGAWPISRERMGAFLEKAMRESKMHSSWRSPHEGYEAAAQAYLDAIFADQELCEEISAFVESLSHGAYANALHQVVLKTMCPGVPDVYQGTELWDYSLVDPDNRRPVDYGARKRMLVELEGIQAEALWRARENGAVKMHVLRECLALRHRYPECFDTRGEYCELEATGTQADAILAFSRGASIIVALGRWSMKHHGHWETTTLALPPGGWNNVLTREGPFEGTVDLATLMGPLPAVVLERVRKEA